MEAKTVLLPTNLIPPLTPIPYFVPLEEFIYKSTYHQDYIKCTKNSTKLQLSLHFTCE